MKVHPRRLPTPALGLAAALLAGCAAEKSTVPLAYVASAANNHVQVIDLGSGRTLRKIYAGATPWRLVVSPGERQLWVQHWYSATTTVVDLDDHEIVRVLPFRGPGAFTPGGERFVTFNWPESSLRVLDAGTFETLAERLTDAPQVYDLAAADDGDTLYMVQFDPMARGPHPRYGYVLAYPLAEEDPARAIPLSYRTGQSPVEVHRLADHPFVLTADSETNGLSLINAHGDGRRIPTCAEPRTLVLSSDETRMLVACRRGEGGRASEIVPYDTDFATRPWPTVDRGESQEVEGAVVAGAFSPAGDRVYLADREGGRLLELDAASLEVLRELPTGDLPVDVAVIEVANGVRDRLAAGKSRGRRVAEQAIAKLREESRPFEDLSWTETTSWLEAAAQDGDGSEPVEKSRRLEFFLKGAGWLRSETEGGGVRLARGGRTVSLDGDGRFWVSPRQELISILYALPNLSPEEAVRHLAGDVSGSPYLRGGMAVDVAAEIDDGGGRYYVIGAPPEGGRTSQLWVDADSGRPTNLGEQFPVFTSGGHDGSSRFGGVLETKFHRFAEVADGLWLPAEIERVSDGRVLSVTLDGARVDAGIPEELFALDRLGGVVSEPSPAVVAPVAFAESADGPGRAVPILDHDYLRDPREPHPPYNSNPPTSGPRLRDLADWGVHRLPVPLELQVHNLEHGGVLIQYNCRRSCPELAASLEEAAAPYESTIVAPYPLMEPRIALTAWGRIDTFEEYDADRVVRFIEAYAGRDHHSPSTTGPHSASGH